MKPGVYWELSGLLSFQPNLAYECAVSWGQIRPEIYFNKNLKTFICPYMVVLSQLCDTFLGCIMTMINSPVMDSIQS